MVVFPVHILASPLALLLTALDAYVLTAAVYLIAKRLARDWAARWPPALRRFITAPAQTIERWLARRRSRRVPPWQPWAVVFGAVFVVRQLVAALIVSTF